MLEKDKVEVSKRGAYKRRGEPSESRVVKTYQPRKCGEDCWARSFPWFREHDFAVKARHAGEPNSKGGCEAAAKDEGHDRCDKKKQST